MASATADEKGRPLCASVIVDHGSQVGVRQYIPSAPLDDALATEYLRRLNIDAATITISLDSLNLLLAAHTDCIAYENVDIILGKAVPTLSETLSTRRCAQQMRGGYCFILVGAFAALLHYLGYHVSLHTGAVGQDPADCEGDAKSKASAERCWGNHVVAVVHLDGRRYIADAGLGDGPRYAFEVAPHSWEEDGFTFSLVAHSGEHWRFTHDTLGSFPGPPCEPDRYSTAQHELTHEIMTCTSG